MPSTAQPHAAADVCQSLRAVGPIPLDFLVPYEEVYQHAISKIDAQFPREKQLQQAYYRESLYYTHQLLLSGRVLFNDSVSGYVSRVADKLLRTRPSLRQELRFYAVRSSAVNAFATGNGIILINVGLIAHLDNEAQLAFILSHEIAHYVKQHALSIFLEARKPTSLSDVGKKEDIGTILVKENLYSREAEWEADTWGTQLYLSSGYNLQAIAGAFDILSTSQSTFAQSHHTILDFLPDGIHLQSQWLAPPPAPSSLTMRKKPSLYSTHPDPLRRKEHVMAAVAGFPSGGRPSFLVSEAQFHLVRDRCRFTCCELYAAEGKYEYCLIGAQYLLRHYPGNHSLRRLTGYAWYGLARHKNAGRFYEVHTPYFPLEGGARHLTWLTEKLSAADLTVFALLASWQLHQQAPDEQLPKEMLRELGADLLRYHAHLFSLDSMGLAYIIRLQPGLEARIRELQLVDTLSQHAGLVFPADRRQLTKTQRQKLLRGLDLGMEKVTFVNPTYLAVDERQMDPVQFLESETQRAVFAQNLNNYAKELDLDYHIVDQEALSKDDVQQFRDLALLQDWQDFYAKQASMSLLSPFHDEVAALCERRGTSYFAWIKCYTFTRNRAGKPLVLAAGFIFPPLLPYSWYYVLTPRYDTVIYVQVYDLAQHTHRLIYPRSIRMRNRSDVVNGHLYDILSQLD